MDHAGQCIRQGPCLPAPDPQGQEAQGPEGLGCGVKGHLRFETGELPKLSSPLFCLRGESWEKGGVLVFRVAKYHKLGWLK